MWKLEEQTRACYSNLVVEDISREKLVKMMLLDGCFVVELLRLYDGKCNLQEDKVDEDGRFLDTRWMLPYLRHDLLLLENQLPLFVLEEIFCLTCSVDQQECTNDLKKLALHFFKPLRPGKDDIQEENSQFNSRYPHLLALFHASFLFSCGNEKCRPPDFPAAPQPHGQRNRVKSLSAPSKNWIPEARKLKNFGLFLRSKSGCRPLDIGFDRWKVEIPTLFIDNNIGYVLRNLLAYEQSSWGVTLYFSTLAVFFSNVARSPDDVAILRDLGIVQKTQGSDLEIVDFFNNLTKELVFGDNGCYISRQLEDINAYCQSWLAKICSLTFAMFQGTNFVKLLLSAIFLVLTFSDITIFHFE